jgi:hypothetical protein
MLYNVPGVTDVLPVSNPPPPPPAPALNPPPPPPATSKYSTLVVLPNGAAGAGDGEEDEANVIFADWVNVYT